MQLIMEAINTRVGNLGDAPKYKGMKFVFGPCPKLHQSIASLYMLVAET